MSLIYKLFRQDPNSRDGIIAATSGLGIVVNLLVAAIKVIVGLMASSIAIVTEGINNAADVVTSVLAFVGAKLAKKHPDEKHPFGYGRVEYLASLVISVLILVTGVEMIISSVKLIFEPQELSISVLSLVVVAVSAVVKFALGTYTMKMGKKADSNALIGVGVDSRNDSFASIITIVTALVFLLFHISLDAYAGIIMSLLILKAGFEILKDTVADLIGRPGEHDLAVQLYREIRNTDGILAAADLMLHNYGPDAWSGSVNVEIDHKKSVGEIYRILHQLQLRIMHEHQVTMTFGVYAVDNDNEQARELRKTIGRFMKERDYIKSFHAVYIDPEDQKIYCDFIVDYSLRDWEMLEREFRAYMEEYYPGRPLELTIETEFV